VETYRVVSAILDRRLVSVTGAPGLGKSALALSALNYLAQRHYFSDGVLYVDVSRATSIPELAAEIGRRTGQAQQSEAAASAAAVHTAAAHAVAAEAESEIASLQLAAAPLLALHCLLVLDGLRPEVLGDVALHAMLTMLLGAARVRTLLTAPYPVAVPLQGGAEKVVELKPLSEHNSALLLARLSPRPLQLNELRGAATKGDFLRRLALDPLIVQLEGNAGRIKKAALRLQSLRVSELSKALTAEARGDAPPPRTPQTFQMSPQAQAQIPPSPR
jgi:hypothetical protein